jgi:hypothetical protein
MAEFTAAVVSARCRQIAFALFGLAVLVYVSSWFIGDPFPVYPDGFPTQEAVREAELSSNIAKISGRIFLGACGVLCASFLPVLFRRNARSKARN